MTNGEMHFKDEILNSLADKANVAQFVSFSPSLEMRFSRVFGEMPNLQFTNLDTAIKVLLSRATERSVNVRSFDPASPKSREFLYGLRTECDVSSAVRRLAANGLYTIINETISIDDGGVSGVVLGDVIEFAPGDTPRCVEKPGTASLPRDIGLKFLKIVYGFEPALNFRRSTRVEFSIHPLRCGVRHDHTIIWELEDVGESAAVANVRWPNRFSQLIGDKVYGLLVAYLYDLNVPETTVVCRSVAPFRFGRDTSSDETWLRTSPRVQVPGKFTTRRGWIDPFRLLSEEDPHGTMIASVLAQRSVPAEYSGAAIATDATAGADLTIEGTEGFGDEFMVGRARRASLPDAVQRAVREVYETAAERLGPVRMEWVFDGKKLWIVQFHTGASPSYGSTIFPGNPSTFFRFDVSKGLEALRELVQNRANLDQGIVLVGDVGVTSHFGDVLRRARIPSRIEAH